MWNKWFKWLETNLSSMVIALLLALTVWIVATQEENPVEQTVFGRAVPIEVVGLRPGLIITNTPPTTTTVELRAPRSTLRSLSVDDFTVSADLNNLGPGTHQVPLQIEIAARAIVVSARPSQIRVTIEEVQQREMPVQLALEGAPPVGYQAGSGTVEPATVTVSGPRSRVSLISEVRATLSLDGLRETIEGDFPLVALDSDGNPISDVTITPQTARVTLPITQEEDFREVAVRVNAANVLPAPGYYISRITADPPLVPVRGDPDIIKNLLFVETQPINLPGLKEDTTVNTQLVPPDGVTLEGIQTVEVTIVVEAQPDFRVLEVPIQTIGLDEERSASLLPDTAVVFLSGPLPVLESLDTRQNIIVSVDVTGLGVGTYQLEPEVEIVSGEIPAAELQRVLVESVLPSLIEVQIRAAASGGS